MWSAAVFAVGFDLPDYDLIHFDVSEGDQFGGVRFAPVRYSGSSTVFEIMVQKIHGAAVETSRGGQKPVLLAMLTRAIAIFSQKFIRYVLRCSFP